MQSYSLKYIPYVGAIVQGATYKAENKHLFFFLYFGA
jgi:hypothetical protein